MLEKPRSDQELIELVQRLKTDFELFCRLLIRIQTKDGEVIPFELNRPQRFLWAWMQDELKAGRPIRWIILKARQEGVSTFICALLCWLLFLYQNRNAIMAAHDDDSASMLYSKIQLAYRLLPDWFRPQAKINNRERLYLTNPDPQGEPGLETQVVVKVAKDVRMGRAFTLHFFHGSEAAFWEDLQRILISIRNAMPQKAFTFLFLESTAQGDNAFKVLWDESDKRGYRRIFLPWVAFDDYRFDLSDAAAAELESSLYDLGHAAYGNEVEERSLILDALREFYPAHEAEWYARESLCRLAWRRETIDQECGGDLTEFKREYPTVPQHAFEATGKSVFSSRRLYQAKERLLASPPPSRVYRWNDAAEAFEPSRYGELTLYEPLQASELYAIGSDPSMGLEGGDPCGAVLLRCGDYPVVAGVIDALLPPIVQARMLAKLGTLANQCLIGCEANDQGGYYINDYLTRTGYPLLYRRERDDLAWPEYQEGKVGWRTTSYTKDQMVNALKTAIAQDEIVLRHLPLIEQLLAYQELPNGKLGCPKPHHDDLVSALCIALQMAHRSVKNREVKPQAAPRHSLKWFDRLLPVQRGWEKRLCA